MRPSRSVTTAQTREVRTWLYQDGIWTGGVTIWSTSESIEELLRKQNARLAGSGLEFRTEAPAGQTPKVETLPCSVTTLIRAENALENWIRVVENGNRESDSEALRVSLEADRKTLAEISDLLNRVR